MYPIIQVNTVITLHISKVNSIQSIRLLENRHWVWNGSLLIFLCKPLDHWLLRLLILSLPLPSPSLVLEGDRHTVCSPRRTLVDAVVDQTDVLTDVDRLLRSFVVAEVQNFLVRRLQSVVATTRWVADNGVGGRVSIAGPSLGRSVSRPFPIPVRVGSSEREVDRVRAVCWYDAFTSACLWSEDWNIELKTIDKLQFPLK